MTVAALSSATEAAWWISLGAGLVVALVVWGLLEALRREVNRIDRNVTTLWTMGKRLAQNTATTHMLSSTAQLTSELEEEVGRHGELAQERSS